VALSASYVYGVLIGCFFWGEQKGKMGEAIVCNGICKILTTQVSGNFGTICTLEMGTILKYLYFSDVEQNESRTCVMEKGNFSFAEKVQAWFSRNKSGTSMGRLG